jgi:hypothetical protein
MDTAKHQLDNAYRYSQNNINTQADSALQQAYVNRMLAEKNLNQQLASQGLIGGASESTRAGLFNSYGNARNEVNRTREQNLAGLEQSYNSSIASLLQNYYDALNNAGSDNFSSSINFANSLANNVAGTYDNLYSNLASLGNNYANAYMQSLTPTTTTTTASANNAYGSDYSNANMSWVGNYSSPAAAVTAKYAELKNSGIDVTTAGIELIKYLQGQGLTEEQIDELTTQAGITFYQ